MKVPLLRQRSAWIVFAVVIVVVTVVARCASAEDMGGMDMGGSSRNDGDYVSVYPPGIYCGALTTAASASSSCDSPAKFVTPLPIPPVVDGTEGGFASITATKGCQQVFHNSDGSPCGSETEIWGYGGRMPGPTVVTRKGVPFDIRHINDLGQDYENQDIRISTHHHGLHMTPAFDGHADPEAAAARLSFGLDIPGIMIYPETSFTYESTNDQEPGTFWYHDHSMHSSGRNVIMGLAGFYIIQPNADDIYDTVQDLPSGEHEIGLAFQDRSFTANNQFDYPMNMAVLNATGFDHIGYFGDYMLVNGVHAPYLNVTRGWYRFRLLNGCNARELELQIETSSSSSSDGSRADIIHQIGTEGGHIAKRQKRSSVVMVPGERYDILVDFSAFDVGTSLYLRNVFVDEAPMDEAPNITDIMEFRIVSGSAPNFTIPTDLVSYSWPSNPTVTRSISLVPPSMMDNGNAGWTIGGIPYNPIVANMHVRTGTTERWVFKSEQHQSTHQGHGTMPMEDTAMHMDPHQGHGMMAMEDMAMHMDPHPMHVHLVQFHIDGLDSGSLMDGWKDTIMVPAHGQKVSFTAMFDGKPGIYLIHCHNLEHQEVGMMWQFELCDDSPDHPCDPTLLKAFTTTATSGSSTGSGVWSRNGVSFSGSLCAIATAMLIAFALV